MSEREKILELLQQFPSEEWINRCFDLLKQMLTELRVKRDDPRLTICIYQEKRILVSFGTLFVFLTDEDQKITFMVPYEFKVRMRMGETEWAVNSPKQKLRWFKVKVSVDKPLPQNLVDGWISACAAILPKRRRAKVKERHLDLLYDFTMEPPVRKEILGGLKTIAV